MMNYLEMHSTEEQTPDQVRLYETCLKGSREEIRKYCNEGDIATQYIKDGMNPMHVVAVAGRSDAEAVLGIMLENGFNVDVPTRSGEDTVLHLIVQHVEVKEAFPLVLKILEFEPDLTIRNRKLRTPYDIALARGEFELAEVLDGSMSAQAAKDYYTQKTAVLYGGKLVDAVLRSNESDVQEFLRLGADPNFVNEHNNGAIHYTITHSTLPTQKTLQVLLDGGADVNLQDQEGDTALNLVIKSTRMRETGDMYACAELLVNNGALSTFKDLDGHDALALAKRRQYEDIVKLLSSVRTQHIQDPPEYSTPVPPAPPPAPQPLLPLPEEDEEEPELAQLVPEQEALIRATRQGTVEDVNEALFTLGADPNLPDDKGLYPIHHAVIRGEMEDENERIDMLRSLVEAGADINAKSVNSESTALHIAATQNQNLVAEFLLDTHKCDYNMQNKHGKTAYDVAEEEDCQEVMDIINNHRKKVRDKMRNAAKKAAVCVIL